MTPIAIEAEVDERERPALVAAAQQLSQALSAAAGADWPIQLRFLAPNQALGTNAPGAVTVLSLLRDADNDAPFAKTEVRWRERAKTLTAAGGPVMLMTVFRHMDDRLSTQGRRRLERVRRLNRMALDLSRDFDLTVVDVDRAFAHIGARVMTTDYGLPGRLAAEVAGHTLVWSLLSLNLDESIPPEAQERAKTFQGPLRQINQLVSRRLSAG